MNPLLKFAGRPISFLTQGKMHTKASKLNQNALLFSVVALSLLEGVRPYLLSAGTLPTVPTALRSLKMTNGQHVTESSIFSTVQASTAGISNRLLDASFKRRDALSVLLGLTIAGAGVESSFAVSAIMTKFIA